MGACPSPSVVRCVATRATPGWWYRAATACPIGRCSSPASPARRCSSTPSSSRARRGRPSALYPRLPISRGSGRSRAVAVPAGNQSAVSSFTYSEPGPRVCLHVEGGGRGYSSRLPTASTDSERGRRLCRRVHRVSELPGLGPYGGRSTHGRPPGARSHARYRDVRGLPTGHADALAAAGQPAGRGRPPHAPLICANRGVSGRGRGSGSRCPPRPGSRAMLSPRCVDPRLQQPACPRRRSRTSAASESRGGEQVEPWQT